MSPCARQFGACCGTASATRERGGAGGTGGGGAWAWKPLAGKPLSPIPKLIGAEDLTQAKNFSGPGGRLMRSSHWELLFLHWEEQGWVKLQRSGRKLECIPQWESILGGCMTRGKRPRTRGPWRASPSPAPSSPLPGQPLPPAAPQAPPAPPRAPLLAQRRTCGPPWAPWGPSDRSRISRYVRS